MIKKDQTLFKKLAVFTLGDSWSESGYFSSLCKKGLKLMRTDD